jgi:hypothetical protein
MAGQPITLTLPAVGDPFPTAAPQVVAAITALEVELERKVVPADMSMSADLSFLVAATNYRVKDLLASSYVLNAAALNATTYPRSLYFTGADGDAYVNDGAGRQVRLTLNGVVNTSGSGSITSTGSPAYGASSVELRWDGADLEYEMRAGAGADAYADVRLDDVIFNDGSGNFLRMTAQAMATDYTVTWPAAVPASTSVVQMSSAGTLTASPTGAIASGAVTSSGLLTGTGVVAGASGITSAGDVDITGGLTVSTTADITGLASALGVVAGASGITSVGNIDLTSGAHVTVAGTGKFKHGNAQVVLSAADFTRYGAFTASDALLSNGGALTSGFVYRCLNDCSFVATLRLPVGSRLVTAVLKKWHGASGADRTFAIDKTLISTGANAAALATSVSGLSSQMVSVSHSPAEVIDVLYIYTVFITLKADDELVALVVTYDQP